MVGEAGGPRFPSYYLAVLLRNAFNYRGNSVICFLVAASS